MTTTIRLTKRWGYVDAPFSTDLLKFARTIPVRFKWDAKTICFDPCRAGIDFMRVAFPDAIWEDAEGVVDHIKALEEYENLPRIIKPNNYKFASPPPFEWQENGFYLTCDMESAAIFFPFGMGKTRVGIDTGCWLFSQGLIDQVLIVAPNGVHRQWIEEQIPKWNTAPLEQAVFTRGQKRLFFERGAGLRWLAVNTESLSSGSGERTCEQYLKQGRTLFLFDESLRIKTPGSSRSHAAKRLREFATYRRILVGCPTTKGYEDLWSQFRFLDPAIIGYDVFTAFRGRYCVTGNYSGQQETQREGVKIVGYQNVEELMAKISPYSVIANKKMLRHEEPTFVERPTLMTKEQKLHYQNFAETLMTDISNGDIVDAPNCAVRLLRYQQIINGFLPRADGTIEYIPSNRINDLVTLLEEIGDKALIWARFQTDIEMIKERLGDKAVTYYGPNSAEQRHANKIAFINDPNIQWLVASQATAGAGLDGLQHVCTNQIFYSNDFDADHRRNAIARLDRSGAIGPIVVTDMVARGTVDRKLIASFNSKESLAQQVMRHPAMLILGEDA